MNGDPERLRNPLNLRQHASRFDGKDWPVTVLFGPWSPVVGSGARGR